MGKLEPFALSRRNPAYAVIEVFAGDNNLANFVARDLAEALQGLGTAGTMLALVDHASRPTEILELSDGRARRLESPGEIDTGNAETLTDFLARGLISFDPEVPVAIGFWDHGSGVFDEEDAAEAVIALRVTGAGSQPVPHIRPSGRLFAEPAGDGSGDVGSLAMLHDDSSRGVLTTREAGSVLMAAVKRAGGRKPAVVFSDTCLNGMVELLVEFGEAADCVIASQDLEPGDGWDYGGFLGRLTAKPSIEDWGNAAIGSYEAAYRARPDLHPCTLAAFRTGDAVTEAFAALVGAVRKAGEGGFRQLDAARQEATRFDRYQSYDLIEFAAALERTASTAAIRKAASTLGARARDARIANVALGPNVAGAQGLSFWFPASEASYERDAKTYARLRFAQETGWADLLAEHRSALDAPSVQSTSGLAPATRDALATPAGHSVRTVVYVHGIANKPPADVLKCQWDRALFGCELGDRSRMAYWVNREYYPKPLDVTCAAIDQVEVDDDEASTRAIMALGSGEGGDEATAIAREIEALSDDPVRRSALASIAARMQAKAVQAQDDANSSLSAVSAAEVQAKLIPLPKDLRLRLAGRLTRAFLRDVNDFLFHDDRRAKMEQALRDRLTPDGGPYLVVAHSQGTMIAYDVLRTLDPQKYPVALFVTIGSPLGMDEVQDRLKDWSGTKTLGVPACVQRWVNVADQLDPVAIDSDLTDEFQGLMENRRRFFLNPDSPFHPHSATGYLSTPDVRRPVQDTVGADFGQMVAPFVLAKDLVAELENSHHARRRAVLIQLVSGEERSAGNLDASAKALEKRIKALVKESGDKIAAARIDRLQRFVAAELTRREVEVLRAEHGALAIKTVWRNAEKRALIAQSTHTVQAHPANLGYGADGQDIAWAVLDTGIRADHPHFARTSYGRNVVAAQFDCMEPGPPTRLAPGEARFGDLDGNGHGTHVAGIIAGRFSVLEEGQERVYSGMAPAARLYGFKVLDDNGRGSDAAIIKALEEVTRINEAAGQLVIHGVNLSLGGAFDPSVYGCGHTPLCEEIKRLWRQGVLTVLAAGNEGYAVLRGETGEIQANLDLSIGDPANLEEAIAVGSVHKTNPHTYGISYFSSRGPTADGRQKPDLVAPGERIVSARHDWRPTRDPVPAMDALYVAMSGTSMAAPHVSGVLAGFLSRRREFIGEPDRVKRILLGGCVDLARDRYMQGAGLANLIKMLAFD